MTYKFSQTGDWCRFTWTASAPKDLAGVVTLLSQVPGVRPTAQGYGLEFHRTLLSIELVQQLVASVPSLITAVPQALRIWQPKRPLFQHQKEALPFLLQARRCLLADSMGLAKSSSGICFAETVMQEYQGRPCIILAKRSLHQNWINELHLAGAVDEAMTLRQIARIESRDQDDASFNPDARYFLINPEIVRDWWPKLTRTKPCVTIIDEAHMYKKHDTNRAKGALMVATAPYCLLLTGTPMPNKPQELWSLLNILHPRAWGSLYDYRIRYCGAERREYGLVDTVPTNTDELKQRMASFYMRRHADAAGLKLPKLSRKVIVVPWDEVKLGKELQKKHEAVFKTMSPRDLKRLVDEGRCGRDTIAALTELRKITSKAKIGTTIDAVRDLREAGESVVVFTWMKEIARKLATALKGYCVTGDHSQKERDKTVEQFKKTGGVIVATYATLSEGHTLTTSRFVVLHDGDWIPATIQQAEKRVDRIGQTRPCMSIWIQMKDSIDEIFCKALAKKLDAIAEVADYGVESDTDLIETVSQCATAVDEEDDVSEMLDAWVKAK